jgi:hypothetical protein
LTLAAFRVSDAGPETPFEELFLCGGTSPSRTLDIGEVHTYHAQVIDCAEGIPPSADQLLLTWRTMGVTYVIGIPRNLELHQPGLLEQLAAFIQVVSPTG